MDSVDVDDGDGVNSVDVDDGDDGDGVDSVDVDNVYVDNVDDVDEGDGDVFDDWLLSVTRPNCDFGSSCELFMLFCGMNVKQLTFD